MSDESKEIRLFDDSVIKLTIKQGTEKERFPVISINETGIFYYNNEEKNITNYDDINSVSGALTTGELGYTRDTNRLFIGNISENLKDAQQQTLGGTLTGNKYLGYVDSRSKIATDNTEINAKPIPLEILLSGETEWNNQTIDSYRTYNFSGEPTKDGLWDRMPYYNSTYDAYDGDYMYDIYRNALILFDHNIRPLNNKNNIPEPDGTNFTLNNKRKTPLIPRFDEGTSVPAQEAVHNLTKDMYGEGYVLFYNVIPDGETLTFENKGFTATNEYHNPDEETVNYSYNVIKINKVPAAAFYDSLDENIFEITNNNTSQIITLKSDLITKIESNLAWDGEIANTSSTNIVVNSGKNIKLSKITLNTLENITNEFNYNSFADGVTTIIENEGYATKDYVNGLIGNLDTGSGSGDFSFSFSGGVMDWSIAEDISSDTIDKDIITITDTEIKITPKVIEEDVEDDETGETNKSIYGAPTQDYFLIIKSDDNLIIEVTPGEFKTNENDELIYEAEGEKSKKSTPINGATNYLTLSFAKDDTVTISGNNLSGYYIPMKI